MTQGKTLMATARAPGAQATFRASLTQFADAIDSFPPRKLVVSCSRYGSRMTPRDEATIYIYNNGGSLGTSNFIVASSYHSMFILIAYILWHFDLPRW